MWSWNQLHTELGGGAPAVGLLKSRQHHMRKDDRGGSNTAVILHCLLNGTVTKNLLNVHPEMNTSSCAQPDPRPELIQHKTIINALHMIC